jgi:hypothetical protein
MNNREIDTMPTGRQSDVDLIGPAIELMPMSGDYLKT